MLPSLALSLSSFRCPSYQNDDCITQKSPTYTQRSPVYTQKSPICTQKSHVHTILPSIALSLLSFHCPFYQHDDCITQKSPIFTQRSPVYAQKSPICTQKSHAYTPMSPVYTQKNPIYTPKSPIRTQKSHAYTPISPVYAQKSPIYTPKSPIYTPKSPISKEPHIQKNPIYTQKRKGGISLSGWRTPIGCLIFIGHFSQKSPVISGSFAEIDLQLKRHPMHLCHPVSCRARTGVSRANCCVRNSFMTSHTSNVSYHIYIILYMGILHYIYTTYMWYIVLYVYHIYIYIYIILFMCILHYTYITYICDVCIFDIYAITPQHTATYCNTLHSAFSLSLALFLLFSFIFVLVLSLSLWQLMSKQNVVAMEDQNSQHTATTHCNTLQHTAAHCKSTLRLNTATHGATLYAMLWGSFGWLR